MPRLQSRGLRFAACLAAAAVLCAWLAGCGGGGPSPADDAEGAPVAPVVRWPDAEGGTTTQRPGCDVLAGPARPGGAFVIAVDQAVDPAHAPAPANPAERLVFGQLYETLVRVRCDGAVEPGLASHWTCTADSTVWIFALRSDARFWDGTPVTAGDVRRSWRDRAPEPGAPAMPPFTWLNADDNSVEVLDAQRLKLLLPEPQGDLPRLLAHPATAVAAPREGWTWPVGSGPARLRATTPAPRPDLECLPNPHHPDAPTWKQLTVQVRPGVDARDLAALGFDLAEVRNLDAVRYYQGLPGYRTDALPWDRLYVLVCPPAVEGAPAAWNPAADRLDPARDLTAAAGRAWPDLAVPAGRPGHCPQLTGPVSYDPPLRRDSDLAHASLDAATVVFPDGDPAARELSGRLAALAGGDARAVPLQAVSVPLAVRWQMAGAAVLPIELEFPCSCLQLAALLAHAAWIQQIATAGDPLAQGDSLGAADRAGLPCDPASLLRRAGAVRPLAITHPWLVTRGHLAGLAYDFDGTPRLAGLGAAAEPGDAP